jgi:predicted porin
MQKKLIALAITAAFASAPAFAADTAAYGLVDAGFGSVSNTATTTGGVSNKTGQSGIAFSQNQTSRVGIKSTEDLGNGMKAIYQLEMGLSTNPASEANFGTAGIKPNASAGFSTYSSIGVDRVLTAGLDFGQGTSLTIGKMSSPLRNIAYGNDAMYGANLIGNLVTMDSNLSARTTQALVAQNFGAVTATVGLLDNTTTADGQPDQKTGNGFEATAVYKQDALSVSGGYRSTKTNTTATNEATTKDAILAANFDLGVAKLYGQFAQVKVDQQTGLSDKKTYETVGVNVPFTPVLAGYVELGTGKHDTGTDSPKYSAYAVGAKYDLSKSTWVYAHVGSAKSDQTTLTAGSKVDQYAIGLLHSF